MALSQKLCAEQGVERAPCRDAGGADRARCARAERRLARKFGRITVLQRKRPQVAVTALARELAGFIWAVMVGRLEPKGAV